MIDPGAIPQIPGDMAVLDQHATTLTALGADFPDTGRRVHSTWQTLGPVYSAPESAQLFAATGPVQTITASVGQDFTAVGGALSAYATEVDAIKTRLKALQDQAIAFRATADADPEWREDEGQVDRHNQLLSDVNAAVADFQDAQRRCANSILALYSDRRYVAENGDGTIGAYEFGYSRDMLDAVLGQGEALPWGNAEEHDRGFFGDVGAFFGGVWTGGVDMVKGLGALIGYADGQWSWSTAGTAWKGLGMFALALSPVALAINSVTDLPGIPKGALGETLLGAGKALIAYDTWGEDKSKAAGMVTFNVVSAVLGTKGAGAALRGGGAAAQASKVAVVAKAGAGAVRVGDFIAKMPTLTDLAGRAVARFPGFKVPHIDIPNIDTPTTHVDVPSGGGPGGGGVPGGSGSGGPGGGGSGGGPGGGGPGGGGNPGGSNPGGSGPGGGAPSVGDAVGNGPARPNEAGGNPGVIDSDYGFEPQNPRGNDGVIGTESGFDAPDAPGTDAPTHPAESTPGVIDSDYGFEPQNPRGNDGVIGTENGFDAPNGPDADAPTRPAESTPGVVGSEYGFEPQGPRGNDGVVGAERGVDAANPPARGADAPATPAPHGAEAPARVDAPEPAVVGAGGGRGVDAPVHAGAPERPIEVGAGGGRGGFDGPTAHTPDTPARGGGGDVPPARGIEPPGPSRGAEVPPRAGVPDQPVAGGGRGGGVDTPPARPDVPSGRVDADPPAGRGPDAPTTPDNPTDNPTDRPDDPAPTDDPGTDDPSTDGSTAEGPPSSVASGPEKARLIEDLQASGTKVDPESVVRIGVDPNGRTVWIEEGGVNPKTGRSAGLHHVMEAHGDQFVQHGVAAADVPELVQRAVTEGRYTGYSQGRRVPGRPIFEIEFGGQTHYVAVSVGNNGYIVGAGMRSPDTPFAGAKADPRFADDPTFRGW